MKPGCLCSRKLYWCYMTRENRENELWYSCLFDKNQNAPRRTGPVHTRWRAGRRLVFGSEPVLKLETISAVKQSTKLYSWKHLKVRHWAVVFVWKALSCFLVWLEFVVVLTVQEEYGRQENRSSTPALHHLPSPVPLRLPPPAPHPLVSLICI